jgi:hypothetical protein
VSTAKLFERYPIAYRRSGLEHWPYVLSVKEVDQLADCHRGPTLRLFLRGVSAQLDSGQHVGGGLARLFGRQLRDLAERHALFRDATSTTVRTVLAHPRLDA